MSIRTWDLTHCRPFDLPKMASNSTDEAPPEVHHYNYIGEVPWDIQKYVVLTRPRPLSSADFLVTGRNDTRSSPDMMKASG
jgi:hypothetical protein